MAVRRTIVAGSAVTLTADRDYTYFTHADNEVEVLDLAAKISAEGTFAAIARPLRLRKMGRLIGVDYNFPEPNPMFIDCPREMTVAELAQDLTQLNSLEMKGVIN